MGSKWQNNSERYSVNQFIETVKKPVAITLGVIALGGAFTYTGTKLAEKNQTTITMSGSTEIVIPSEDLLGGGEEMLAGMIIKDLAIEDPRINPESLSKALEEDGRIADYGNQTVVEEPKEISIEQSSLLGKLLSEL